MELTNGEIWLAKEPLNKLADMKLPVKTAYAIAKMASKLNDQLQVIEAVRIGLIRKYGVQEGKNWNVKEDSENWPKFMNDFDELMKQKVEVVVEKVKLPDNIEIESKVLIALTKFVEV